MSTGLWNGTAGLGRRPSLTLGNQSLWSGASSLVSPGAWLPPAYAGATLALDLDGSMSGIPGAAYLNGTYYNAFADVPGATVTGGAGFATAVNAAGQVVGPFAANTLPATSAGAEVWEARTNLATRSGNTAIGWAVTGGSQVTGQPDPLGGSGAGLFTADGSTGTHFIILDGVSFVSGTTYTLSIFAKAGTTDRLQLTGASTAFGASQYANFLLSGTGSVSASAGLTSSAIVQLAGGWYRCSITLPASASATGAAMAMSWLVTGSETRIPNTAASGSFYIWGAQLEAGSFPSPYIPTTTAAATRTAIAPSITGLGSILTPPFTMYAEAYLPAIDGTERGLIGPSDGTSANRIDFRRESSSNRVRASVITGSVSQGGVSSTAIKAGARNIKAAVRLRSTAVSLSVDGAVESPLTVTAPTLSALAVGLYNGGNFLNGQIRRILILPDMSDAQLQAITA